MNTNLFATRMQNVSGAAIKEILSMMTDPDLISFGGGSPAKESFPLEAIEEITLKVLKENPYGLLQYAQSEGYMPLRKAYLEKIVKPKGVKAELSNVVTLTGSAQGFDLLCQAVVSEGDVVLLESPTFLAVFNVLKKLGAKIVPVETDECGILIDDLEAKIQEHKPKMLYCIPTFQNPTGRTLPIERRKRIAELCEEFDFIVAEDDPYCELRYSGNAVDPIKNYDKCGNVVLINSFSKIVSPGLRVGAMVADEAIVERICTLKQCADTHTPNITQAICAEFLNRDLLPAHLDTICELYRTRMEAMIECMEKYFPKGYKFTRPEGGLFLWVELPENIDAKEVLKKCVAEYKVGFVPGAPFFADSTKGHNTMRLNFSSTTPDIIEKGMESIGKVLSEMM